MEYHKQTERVWVESPINWIIYVMWLCPFLDLHKLETMHHMPNNGKISDCYKNIPVKSCHESAHLSHWSTKRVWTSFGPSSYQLIYHKRSCGYSRILELELLQGLIAPSAIDLQIKNVMKWRKRHRNEE